MPIATQLRDSEIEHIAHPLVREIFSQYHPDGEFIGRPSGGVIDRLLGVDDIFKDKNGKVFLLGSKIRRPAFAHNIDFTIEEYNNPETLRVGDLYNSRMDEYLYGFISEDCTCITKWIYIYFQPIVSLILEGVIPCTQQYNDKHGCASFLAVKSVHIPLKYIIGYKNFPIMETSLPFYESLVCSDTSRFRKSSCRRQ